MKTGRIALIIEGGAQRVDTDDGQVIWLLGIDRLSGGQVGERVTLTWRSTMAYSLWFPERVSNDSVVDGI